MPTVRIALAESKIAKSRVGSLVGVNSISLRSSAFLSLRATSRPFLDASWTTHRVYGSLSPPPVPLGWFMHQAKKVLLFYAYGSLLAALLAPRWAVEYPYTMGLIPGFNVRLHGLVLHANSLAPLLLTYLVLSWFSPSRPAWTTSTRW